MFKKPLIILAITSLLILTSFIFYLTKRINLNTYCKKQYHSSLYKCGNGNYSSGVENLVVDGCLSIYDKWGLELTSTCGWTGTNITKWGGFKKNILNQNIECEGKGEKICDSYKSEGVR